jgi:CheY-like chemotaxis protein
MSPGPRVLIVEDEPHIVLSLELLLQRAGYVVHAAANPAAAIDLAGRCRDSIDLLLTDVVMPGMTGDEVAVLVKKSHPEAQVLYVWLCRHRPACSTATRTSPEAVHGGGVAKS